MKIFPLEFLLSPQFFLETFFTSLLQTLISGNFARYRQLLFSP
jgi:hypothetical protein